MTMFIQQYKTLIVQTCVIINDSKRGEVFRDILNHN